MIHKGILTIGVKSGLRGALAQLRGQAQVARLALESLTEATRKGQPTDALLPMCDSALESMRPH